MSRYRYVRVRARKKKSKQGRGGSLYNTPFMQAMRSSPRENIQRASRAKVKSPKIKSPDFAGKLGTLKERLDAWHEREQEKHRKMRD